VLDLRNSHNRVIGSTLNTALMPTRHQHDPFLDAPLRPTSLNPSVRAQASLAPSRSRPQRDLFAPALLRRPTSRATPRVADEVLADPDSDDDNATHQHLQQQRRLRRIRGASPLRPRGEEDVEIVNRQPDGGYLLGAKETNETIAALIWAPELQDAKVASGEKLSTYWEEKIAR